MIVKNDINMCIYNTYFQSKLLKDYCYFLLSFYGRESIVLGSNFQNEDFDGFTLFQVS